MIKFLNQKEGFKKINSLAKNKKPFLFIISYDKSQIFACELKKLPKEILFAIGSNWQNLGKKTFLTKYPINFFTYLEAFGKVIENIKAGNTYLFNLTFKTKIETNLNLKEIYLHAKAPYKLYIKDSFVCFSPECFIKIKGNIISTYPMKGTIDASLPNAKEQILANQKELAEHTMIVDLLRNDLNIVASSTNVEQFRYTQKIKAGSKELLQVSSKIKATLCSNWHEHLGDILDKITPAGSITGTPKKKTVELIEQIEQSKRNLYTGIFGVFDGANLDSAVMIRAISKESDGFYYYSGGGITLDSNAKDEYKEMIDKIYIPT